MFEKYVIQDGDNLNIIANRFNTRKSVIKDINNIAFDDMIRAGMEIIVPKGSKKYFDYYTIKKGDTLYQIALQYNINPELLANMNGLNMSDYIYPGQEILIPKNGYSYYITMEGDTLDTVADKFRTDVAKVLNDNETIYLLAGQLIVKERQN